MARVVVCLMLFAATVLFAAEARVVARAAFAWRNDRLALLTGRPPRLLRACGAHGGVCTLKLAITGDLPACAADSGAPPRVFRLTLGCRVGLGPFSLALPLLETHVTR